MIPKGHRFYGPELQGYELTEDAIEGMVISSKSFRPFGGAPQPLDGMSMPVWLHDQIQLETERWIIRKGQQIIDNKEVKRC